MNFDDQAICDRLRILRLRAFGPRGKAQFAKRLGIRASTYQQYESTRIPPVDLLIRAAAIGHCDLLWLLIGDAAGKPTFDRETSGEQPVIARVRELLDRRPETAQSLSAFLTLIDPPGPPSTEPAVAESPEKAETLLTRPTNEMVPVVGSTAAGPARVLARVAGRPAARRALGGRSERPSRAALGRMLPTAPGRRTPAC